MLRDLVRTGSLVLALLGATALSAGNAVAQQQQPPAAQPQQQQQQEKAQQTPSGRWARRSQARTRQAPSRPTIGVRQRCLGGSGGPENTETVPAKFSEQNAADDKLRIAANMFKLLTEEQRRAIYTALKGQPPGPAFNADIGKLSYHPRSSCVRCRTRSSPAWSRSKTIATPWRKSRAVGVAGDPNVVGIFVDDVLAPKAREGRRTP